MTDNLDIDKFLFSNIRKASRVINRALDNVLRPFGITGCQFLILAELSSYGGSSNKNMTHIGKSLHADTSTIKRAFIVLCRKGLIEAVGSPDKRFNYFRLTENGKNIFDSCLKLCVDFNNKISDIFDKDSFENFNQFLESICLNFSVDLKGVK